MSNLKYLKFEDLIIMPLKKSEWFYISPDTFEVRANWEIDIGKIKRK